MHLASRGGGLQAKATLVDLPCSRSCAPTVAYVPTNNFSSQHDRQPAWQRPPTSTAEAIANADCGAAKDGQRLEMEAPYLPRALTCINVTVLLKVTSA